MQKTCSQRGPVLAQKRQTETPSQRHKNGFGDILIDTKSDFATHVKFLYCTQNYNADERSRSRVRSSM